MSKTIDKIAYEKYQLDWMIQHGHSIDELFRILRIAIEENDAFDITSDTAEYAEHFFKKHGFYGGEMYVCYDEFLDAEYTNVQYMRQLLTEKEFLQYLKDNFSAYDYFEVSEDGTVKIIEYGYMSDGSVTDNSKETSRIAECSGAEFNQNELTGDEDDDWDMTNLVLENAKQYMDDVTDERLCERISELLSEGIEEADYHDSSLKAGKYIWLQK